MKITVGLALLAVAVVDALPNDKRDAPKNNEITGEFSARRLSSSLLI